MPICHEFIEVGQIDIGKVNKPPKNAVFKGVLLARKLHINYLLCEPTNIQL